jgi:integrase
VARAGSIRPRPDLGPDAWEIRVGAGKDLGAPARADGRARYRQVSRIVRGGKRAATVALRDLVAEVDAGDHRKTEGTVAHLLEQWLAHAEHDLSPSTIRRYRGLARAHIVPALGGRRLDAVTPGDLDALYARLRSRGLAPATVRQVHAVVRRAFAVAVRWRWLSSNPAADAQAPKVRAHEAVPPTLDEYRRVLAEVRSSRAGPELLVFLVLAAHTGARRGELCGLRWSDVDLEAGSVGIVRSVVELDGGRVAVKDTKSGGRRRIALDDATVMALRAHRAAAVELAGGRLPQDAFVFTDDPDGSAPWKPGRVTRAWDRCRKRAGVPARLHDLRHLHASELLAAGVPVRTVAGRLGHDPTMTLRVYGHITSASDREAANIIGRVLG